MKTSAGKSNKPTESRERWGTWEDAEYWRKESFLRMTPAQRLAWLEEMLDLAYATGALKPYSEGEKATSLRQKRR